MKEIQIHVQFTFATSNPIPESARNDAGKAFTQWLEHCSDPRHFGLKFREMIVDPIHEADELMKQAKGHITDAQDLIR